MTTSPEHTRHMRELRLAEEQRDALAERLRAEELAAGNRKTRRAAELERERRSQTDTKNRLTTINDRYNTLTERLTVGVLRKAGYIVRIEETEFCDACGEEF